MTCTFCGHGQIFDGADRIKEQLRGAVLKLVEAEGVRDFLVGNYGAFDRMAAAVCLEIKRQYPHITVTLVVPYYRPLADREEKAWHQRFDQVVVPALEDTPYPYRIVKANQYMVDRAAVVVAYVTARTGGAAKTLEYARRKQKRIVCLR